MSQKKGLSRNTIDKFYTNATSVSLCINAFLQHVDIAERDVIIEPSAGDGAFIESIKDIKNTKNITHIFLDIDPEHKEILKYDFLSLDICSKFNINMPQKIHIIGNPPFGRQSASAIKFIKKAADISTSISFILPKSFKKESLRRAFPPRFHLEYEVDLPRDSFLVNKLEYNVPCVFQIWIKREIARSIQKTLVPTEFTFVKKDDSPDISFRRVGVNAGTVSRDILDKSEQSHYFIKFNELNSNTDEIYTRMSRMTFLSDNTVGPRSISKQELIHAAIHAIITPQILRFKPK